MSGDQTGHCLDTLVIWNKYFFLCKKLCAQHSFCSLQYVYAILVTAWQGSMERKHRNQQKCVQTSSKWCPWTTLGASAWLSQGMVLRFLLGHQQKALFRLVWHVTSENWSKQISAVLKMKYVSSCQVGLHDALQLLLLSSWSPRDSHKQTGTVGW